MKNIAACLLVLASAASAAPQAPTPPPPPPTDKAPAPAPTCKPSGDPILAIEHDVVAGVKQPTTATKLYANGAWTLAETDADGKPGRSASGCLAKDEVTRIKTALDGAPWKITHPKAHCMAMAQTFTVFSAGTNKFTEKLCGTDILDDKTKAALDDADKTLGAAAASATPPCCKK
jgi:hypothetical protein